VGFFLFSLPLDLSNGLHYWLTLLDELFRSI